MSRKRERERESSVFRTSGKADSAEKNSNSCCSARFLYSSYFHLTPFSQPNLIFQFRDPSSNSILLLLLLLILIQFLMAAQLLMARRTGLSNWLAMPQKQPKSSPPMMTTKLMTSAKVNSSTTTNQPSFTSPLIFEPNRTAFLRALNPPLPRLPMERAKW